MRAVAEMRLKQFKAELDNVQVINGGKGLGRGGVGRQGLK